MAAILSQSGRQEVGHSNHLTGIKIIGFVAMASFEATVQSDLILRKMP